MAQLSPLFTWRSAICESGLPATARHVALTLSLYMNERGGSAFPGAERLARDTGLSDRAVRTQLALLVETGWLRKVFAGGGRHKAAEFAANKPGTSFTESQSLNGMTRNPEPDDAKPCTTFTPRRQEDVTKTPRGKRNGSAAAPDPRVATLVGGYVEDYRHERDGHNPPTDWKAAAGREIRRALADGERAEDIAVCLGVIAHESKRPAVLRHVLADYHANRERRTR